MRILLVSPVLPHRPSAAGAARVFTSHLIDDLSARHTLGVVAATDPADTAMARAWLAGRAAPVEIVPAGRWCHAFSGRPGAGLRALAEALRRATAVFQPDVIHLESALLAPLARVAGAPCVLACHDAPAVLAGGATRATTPGWQRLRARLVERREADWARAWFGAVGACVVESEHDRRATSAYLPFERIDVISAGIDAERYAYRRIGEPGRLVFTGDLGRPGDVEAARRLATSILPAIRRRNPRTDLVIASTGTAEPARALGRVDGVRVEGRLADLRPTLWGGAASVSPLTGVGRTTRLLEALALGTPVIGSPASLSRLDAVVPGHHVLSADSDADFADAVCLLMREPVVANTIARNARELVERSLTWRAATQRYEDVYRRVAQRPMEQAA
jgi:glycosyltransferase involved in cell wall biosynthesis